MQSVVGQLGHQVVDQHQPLQLGGGAELVDFLEVADFVVHEEDVLDVGESVAEVVEGLDSIVGEDEGAETVEEGEVGELADFVIAEVDALKEVLSRRRSTRVAPMFSMVVIL